MFVKNKLKFYHKVSHSVLIIISMVSILFFLQSCKEIKGIFSSNDNNEKDEKIITVQGKLANDFKPKQSLKIFSVYQGTKSINNNKFAVAVSKRGPQILFALDSDSSIRALTITTKENNKLKILDIGPKSTALVLTLLRPELLGLSFDTTAYIISMIKQIPLFESFKKFVQDKMQNESLVNLAQSQEYIRFVNKIYDQLIQAMAQKSKITKLSGLDYFDVNLTVANLTKLCNSGFRFVSVYRRDIAINGSEKTVEVFPKLKSMKGRPPYEFSVLATGSYPNCDYDTSFPPTKDYDYSEYWIQGPGVFKPFQLPATVPTDIKDPWGLTILTYIIGPSLGIFLGTFDDTETISGTIDLWNVIKSEFDSFELLENSPREEFYANFINYIKHAIWLVAQRSKNKLLSNAINIIDKGILLLNLSTFETFFYSANSIAKFTIQNPLKYVTATSIVYQYFHDNCSGPKDWYKPGYFPTIGWKKLTYLPWQKYVTDRLGDAFFIIHFNLDDTSDVKIKIQSDDGHEFYINGYYFGWAGGVLCHQEGCVNMGGLGCRLNQEIGEYKNLGKYLHLGDNVLAVHVSNGCPSRMYFNFFIKRGK